MVCSKGWRLYWVWLGWSKFSSQQPTWYCFRFVTKTTLKTHPCFSCCWAVLVQLQGLCFSLCPSSGRLGVHKKPGGDKARAADPKWPIYIPHHPMSSSAKKTGLGGGLSKGPIAWGLSGLLWAVGWIWGLEGGCWWVTAFTSPVFFLFVIFSPSLFKLSVSRPTRFLTSALPGEIFFPSSLSILWPAVTPHWAQAASQRPMGREGSSHIQSFPFPSHTGGGRRTLGTPAFSIWRFRKYPNTKFMLTSLSLCKSSNFSGQTCSFKTYPLTSFPG